MSKILIIEDEENTSSIIATFLSDEGHECIEAPDGLKGIELAEQVLPDLIICDVQMPGLNGLAVLEKLSSIPITADIPFIFLTGNTSPEDIRRGMTFGADDYLCKPFNGDDLVNAVNARLKKNQAQKEKRKEAVEQTRQEVTRVISHDTLTGLPNHLALPKAFTMIADSNTKNCGIGMLLIGIDRLRHVNETFGRAGGDHVVVGVTERIRGSMRHSDSLFRGESDTFIILIPNLKRQDDLQELVRRIFRGMSSHFEFDKKELHITVSMGGSFCPPGSLNWRMVLDQAQLAQRYARDSGGNGFQCYNPDMKKLALDRLTLEGYLAKAKDRNEFYVVYQAKADAVTNRIEGMEALLRWKHSELGNVPPGQFVPIAEDNGLILQIGEWILETACRRTKKWKDDGFGALKVAINVSGRQLEPQNLPAVVEKVLHETKLPPECLELEVTESVLVKNPSAAAAQLTILKSKGITIAIDDFGTGYSSLNYLRQFPVDTLKLDQAFVRNIGANASDLEIVSTIIKMAHNLKLKVVAEGVETRDQLTCLQILGCDQYQGYLLSKPIEVEAFNQFLAERKD